MPGINEKIQNAEDEVEKVRFFLGSWGGSSTKPSVASTSPSKGGDASSQSTKASDVT